MARNKDKYEKETLRMFAELDESVSPTRSIRYEVAQQALKKRIQQLLTIRRRSLKQNQYIKCLEIEAGK